METTDWHTESIEIFTLLDPLTASSLTGTIVQFADFVSTGQPAAAFTVNEELRLITADLSNLVRKLPGSSEPSYSSSNATDDGITRKDKDLTPLCDVLRRLLKSWVLDWMNFDSRARGPKKGKRLNKP
jgi:hypothetical protein